MNQAQMRTGRALVIFGLLSLPMIACALLSPLTGSSTAQDIELTNEAVLATNAAIEAAVISTATAEAARYLHVQVTDGEQPVEATIQLAWLNTDQESSLGPTSDVVLPVPVNGSAISITVTAPGFLAWSAVLVPTESLDVTVRLTRE